MSKHITLHPEHGINPSMEQHICPIHNGPYNTNSILLMGRNKGEEADMNTITGYSTCPECQEMFDDGRIALIPIDPDKSEKGENGNFDILKTHRTSATIWARKEYVEHILDAPVNDEVVFISQEFADDIKDDYNKAMAEQEGENGE